MSLNVLVIDDSAVMRSMLIRTLRHSALPLTNVYQAAEGEAALALLAEHDVDLAFIDADLPGMSCEAVVRQARADARLSNVTLVAVCAEGRAPGAAPLEALGVALLEKPFTPEEVRSGVLRLLGVVEG